jgi:hypothetical protein
MTNPTWGDYQGEILGFDFGRQENYEDLVRKKEAVFSNYIDSLEDEEFDEIFPDDSDDGIEEVKWIFDVAGGYIRRALTGRRRKRKKRR